MFDFDELFKGYSNTDEYVARDSLILDILINKGVITNEDVKEFFTPELLLERIKNVQEIRKKQSEKSLEKYKKDYEENI